jgi:hypothetical protein
MPKLKELQLNFDLKFDIDLKFGFWHLTLKK